MEPNPADKFPLTVGMFIHHCGALELLVNNSINFFAEDDVLSASVLGTSLFRRIQILKQLLHERSNLTPDDIDTLYKDLEMTRLRRNDVAHNAIFTKAPDDWAESVIIVQKHKPDGTIVTRELPREEVRDYVNQSKELMIRFVELVPEATSDGSVER